jgi:putative membrane protein
MKRGSWYYWFLLIVFLAFWAWAAINPNYREAWLLENYLVFIFVPIILIAGFYFKLSKISYTLITMFMILHVIGSHYTYAEVPFGYILQAWFGSSRNMYDRLVHFCFGLLIAYPVREVFLRLSKARGFWGYWFPIELTFAFSAIYELIEWGSAIFSDPNAGLAFLGSQGDVWDAQKDMAMAGLGSIVAMLVVSLINLSFKGKVLWLEIKESFKIRKDDMPLGEVALERLAHKQKVAA